MRRRKPDTVEVEMIKREAQEEKMVKQKVKAELEMERQKRLDAEAKAKQLEDLLEQYRKENARLRTSEYIIAESLPSEVPASVDQSDSRPTGDQEVAGSIPTGSGNILSCILIMNYFPRSFSSFR